MPDEKIIPLISIIGNSREKERDQFSMECTNGVVSNSTCICNPGFTGYSHLYDLTGVACPYNFTAMSWLSISCLAYTICLFPFSLYKLYVQIAPHLPRNLGCHHIRCRRIVEEKKPGQPAVLTFVSNPIIPRQGSSGSPSPPSSAPSSSSSNASPSSNPKPKVPLMKKMDWILYNLGILVQCLLNFIRLFSRLFTTSGHHFQSSSFESSFADVLCWCLLESIFWIQFSFLLIKWFRINYRNQNLRVRTITVPPLLK